MNRCQDCGRELMCRCGDPASAHPNNVDPPHRAVLDQCDCDESGCSWEEPPDSAREWSDEPWDRGTG